MQVFGDADAGDVARLRGWLGARRSVVTIGAYDGVHLGHRAVIGQARSEAARDGAASVVVTFDRHPASVVRPESAPRLLTSHAHKLELLAATGVDAVLVVAFTPDRALEAPVDFVERVLVGALAARTVIVGEDFHFGHRRGGNVGLLHEVGARRGFEVAPVALVARADGVDEPVSSTAIRRALAGGDVAAAARMLGRDHEVRGRVVHGDRRGREIGFPTANVAVDAEACLPADGVYAGRLARAGGGWHGCAVNLGRRPTFVDRSPASLLEAHVLDFDGDLYGESVRVSFVAFLRGERKFDGVQALASQLKLDVDHARTLLA